MKLHEISGPTVRRTLNKNCLGAEDLTFYFGVRNERVNRHASRYANPIAFAARTEYNSDKGWGKGFIWFAPSGSIQPYSGLYEKEKQFPDWSLESNLDGIILHELGHVYGCEHVEQTIMDEDVHRWTRLVSDYPDLDGKTRKDHLTEIDGKRELYICEDCESHYQGGLGFAIETCDQKGCKVEESVTENFELLTGKKPSDIKKVQAEVHGNQKSGFVLTVKDNGMTYNIPLELLNSSLTSRHAGRPVFKTVTTESLGPGTIVSLGSPTNTGLAFPSSLTTQSGEKVSLVIERNMASTRWGQGNFNLKYYRNGKSEILFTGELKSVR